MDLSKAQTGRTTKLLLKAIELIEEGKHVYFVCASNQAAEHAKRLNKDTFGDVCESHKFIKFETLTSLGNYNLFTGNLDRASLNCAVVVYHFVVESEIDHLEKKINKLKELYDIS